MSFPAKIRQRSEAFVGIFLLNIFARKPSRECPRNAEKHPRLKISCSREKSASD